MKEVKDAIWEQILSFLFAEGKGSIENIQELISIYERNMTLIEEIRKFLNKFDKTFQIKRNTMTAGLF